MKSLHELADTRGVSLYPKGSDFVRVAVALAVSKNDLGAATEYAAARWGRTSRSASVVKGAVEALTTGDATSGDLVSFRGAGVEFFSVVNQASIIGRLGLRRVPFDVRTLTALDGATASWVGQGQAKPLTRTTFSKSSLPRLKVACLSVVTDELLESSDPSAETVIRADLVRATVNALDVSFIDPTNGGTDGIEPAAVTFGATEVAATADPAEDLRDLIAAFEGDLDSAMVVTHPAVAVALSSTDRPGVGARGGSLMGIPVVASRNVPAGLIVLLDPSGIAYAEDGGEIRTSRNASILMDSEPAMHVAEMGSPSAPLAATMVSMFQTSACAVVVARSVNWAAIRPGSVAYISGASYGMGSP